MGCNSVFEGLNAHYETVKFCNFERYYIILFASGMNKLYCSLLALCYSVCVPVPPIFSPALLIGYVTSCVREFT